MSAVPQVVAVRVYDMEGVQTLEQVIERGLPRFLVSKDDYVACELRHAEQLRYLGSVIDQTRKQHEALTFNAQSALEAAVAANAKSAKYETAMKAIVAIFEDEGQSGDSDTMLNILDLAEEALK